METYKALIREAIAALPEHDGAVRRAVYEKARSALAAQLRALDPPLQAADIKRSRLLLEETIHQVEREFVDTQAAEPLADAEKGGSGSTNMPPTSHQQKIAATEGQVIDADYAVIALPGPDEPDALSIDPHDRVRGAVLALEQVLGGSAQGSPELKQAVTAYRAAILTELGSRDEVDLWSEGGALANLLVAARALEVPGLEVHPLSRSSYRLEALIWEHGASLIGYALMRRIMTIAEAFVRDRNLGEQLERLYPAAESAIASDAEAAGDAIGSDRHLAGETSLPGAASKMQ